MVKEIFGRTGVDHEVAHEGGPLVSVIIPTKNRHQQLHETLEANKAVGQFGNVEFLIADNSPAPASQEMQDAWRESYANFVYAHNAEPRSIIGNFNFGLKQARGRYLIFIGDDDFVLPELIDAALFAKQNGVECVVYEPDRYYWSSCSFAQQSIIGPMCLVKNKARSGRDVDPSAELIKSARNGFLTIESLPRAYHGLVQRHKMMSLAAGDRQPVFGGSPDISMAAALALAGTRTIFWERPLSIYGASTGSGGGMTTSKTHFLQLHQATFLDPDFVKMWPPNIPRYWSEYTVFPASVLHVHAEMEIEPKEFNLAAAYASILVNERIMWREVWTTFAGLPANTRMEVLVRFPVAFGRKFGGWLVRRLVNMKLLKKPSNQTIIGNVSHVELLANYKIR